MLEKKKYYESRNGRHVYSTPQMLTSLEQSEDIINYLFRKMNWERGTSWEKLSSTNYLQGQIYKRFVRSSGNIVHIILVAFFEVRPIK